MLVFVFFHLSGYDNIFENEVWYFRGNMKVFWERLDWGMGTKDPQSDPADKAFWAFAVSAMFLIGQTFC